jgi:hypothetical protein
MIGFAYRTNRRYNPRYRRVGHTIPTGSDVSLKLQPDTPPYEWLLSNKPLAAAVISAISLLKSYDKSVVAPKAMPLAGA